MQWLCCTNNLKDIFSLPRTDLLHSHCHGCPKLSETIEQSSSIGDAPVSFRQIDAMKHFT